MNINKIICINFIISIKEIGIKFINSPKLTKLWRTTNLQQMKENVFSVKL